MNPRLKIAAETRKTAREIFASLPHDVRFATVLRAILKQALDFGNNETSLGLAALTAMAQRGTQGRVFEVDMDEIRQDLKRNNSKVYKIARSLGTTLLKAMSRYSSEVQDRVVQNLQDKLLFGNHDLKGNFEVPQAVTYLKRMVQNEASTVARSKEFKLKQNPDELSHAIDNFMSNPRLWAKLPRNTLNKVKRDLLSKPIFQDDSGNPRMYQYLEAMMVPISERAFADEIGVSVQAFRKWLEKPNRQKALKETLAPLLVHFESV